MASKHVKKIAKFLFKEYGWAASDTGPEECRYAAMEILRILRKPTKKMLSQGADRAEWVEPTEDGVLAIWTDMINEALED